MSQGRSQRLQDLWFPGLVAFVGVLCSFAVWGLLVADRRDRILASARDTAAETHDALVLALQQQIGVLESIQVLWSEFGLAPNSETQANAEARAKEITGLATLAFVDVAEPDNQLAVGRARSNAEKRRDAELAARIRRIGPHFEGPERNASGRFGYRVLRPVRTPDGQTGALVARFEVDPFLGEVLQARARGYALSVLWDDQQIFSRDIPTSDPWQRWWHVEDAISLPIRGEWRVVHRPTPESAALYLTPLPHYLFASGLLVSLLLGVMAHQLRLILRQSRFLAASNRALERRGNELEARVTTRTEALHEAIAELEAFNYSVSHDLRTPLSAILNFTTILEEDYRDRPLDAEGMAMIARIRRSASRATALLQDLLRLSHAGRAALTLERVDMTALARESFAQVWAAELDDDVEFIVDPLPEAIGDRSLLSDVLANLFGNALKYSRGCEKRRILVSGRIENGECIYEVADNGRGFDMRFVDKLFGLFERLHHQDEIDGTGVGLAMVARIVKRHGGRVFAEGRPDAGARFSFTLPMEGRR